MLAKDVFHKLMGTWEVKRQVYGSSKGIFEGQARFFLINSLVLHYREEGLMYTKDQTFSAYREYFYVLEEEAIAIYFDREKKNLFHRVSFSTDRTEEVTGSGMHFCKDDLYLSSYRFALPNQFAITHKVKGPKKEYAISTSYRKKQGASSTLLPSQMPLVCG